MRTLEQLEKIGTFKIYSSIDNARSKCFDISGNSKASGQDLILYEDNSGKNQSFIVHMFDENYFVLEAEHSGLVLDIYGGHGQRGAKIIQYPFHGGDNQLFRFEENDDGTYTIVSKWEKMVLDLKGNSTQNYTPVILWDRHGGANQRFCLKCLSGKFELADNVLKKFERISGNYDQ